jgi:plastocyanin
MVAPVRERPRTRRAAATLVALLSLLAVAGCGGDDGGSGATASKQKVDIPDSKFDDQTGKATVDVDVVDNAFEAPYVKVSGGTKVRWTNNGRNQHNVQPAEDGSFQGVDTAAFAPGQSYSAIFDSAGDYPYYCSIHGTKNLNGQSGVVRVVAGGSS